VDRGENIVLDNALTDENGVLIVVAVPRNEAYKNVASERQLTTLCCGTVSQHFTGLNMLAERYDRLLVETGILVGSLVFLHLVGIQLALNLCRIRLNHHTVGAYIRNRSTSLGLYQYTTVIRGLAFHAGTHTRGFGEYKGNRLTLHVRTHQGSVGIVVLKERNKGGCNTDDLLRINVHVLDFGRRLGGVVSTSAYRNLIVMEIAVTVQLG